MMTYAIRGHVDIRDPLFFYIYFQEGVKYVNICLVKKAKAKE